MTASFRVLLNSFLTCCHFEHWPRH